MIQFLAAFIPCFILTPLVIKFATQRRLFDKPNERKIHSDKIPRLGGIAIMGALLLSFFLFADSSLFGSLRLVLAGLLILFFVGLWDDMQPIPPLVKLLGEVIPILLLVYTARIPLQSLAPDISWMYMLEYPITILLAFWFINAFNLIDGINGLAGSIGMIALLGMGLMGEELSLTLSMAYAGALLAFLFFNFVSPRIFMGDCGSLPIGYIITFGMTQLSWAPCSEGSFIASEPMIALALIVIPLFDMVRVFAIRIHKRKNPFIGDRNHLHHLMLETGESHISSTLKLSLLSVFVTSIVYFLIELGQPFCLFTPLVLLGVPLIFTAFLWKKVIKIRMKA